MIFGKSDKENPSMAKKKKETETTEPVIFDDFVGPLGAKPIETEPEKKFPPAETLFIPVRCPRCQSENREKFTGTARVVNTGGKSPITNLPYNVVKFRNCLCADCGQKLSVKSYEWSKEREAEVEAINFKLREDAGIPQPGEEESLPREGSNAWDQTDG